MVFDLRGALLKKAEVESARLDDFEFRLRARTFRLLAERHALDPEPLVGEIATDPDDAILARHPALHGAYAECRALARQLIDERGDPTPYKLA
ncbi:hypothetical protein FHS95_000615 [Sphingomonas naasensis]|uniref:Uncharacterized protein n=1 Tax=Sphingomonas naasensis TaxID=1344951 RepID=A0A4S1WRZ4_9SPHN|nr:hypothetical protein [Sphingomonas naasensis]NIJ18946.1 hypothetical protein [Sphingomonas naasensis]TGX46161.1 hypothetical protein E5A74_03075 [Sphingomonas naasensis]